MLRSSIIYKVLPYVTDAPCKNIMFDLETLGKRAGYAPLSIGAVAFDPYAEFTDYNQEISLTNQFFAKISLASCNEAGLRVDKQTELWWADQPRKAYENAFGGTTPLKEALEAFRAWLFEVCGQTPEGDADCNVWSHGEDFDQPILNHAFEAVGISKPWPYNGGRDTRTALEMGGVKYKGVTHMAVEDSLAQARAVHLAFANLGLAQFIRED